MLLAWAVSCDAYELRDDGTANIFGAGFDTFRVETLPAELDMDVVLRLMLQEDEESTLAVHVLGPDTTPIDAPLTFPITPNPGPNHRQGYTVSQIEALRLIFLAEMEGIHSVEIYADADAPPSRRDHRETIFFNVIGGLLAD